MSVATLTILLYGAASVAVIHTIIGVDHYLPFVVIGRARRWSLRRTLSVTGLCGVGHVVGSVALGLVGVGLGVGVGRLELIEGFRGSVAAWGLIGFGLVYAAWSMVQVARGRQHAHLHVHGDGIAHDHDHHHQEVDHLHPHAEGKSSEARLTSWTLFVIFIFGPCEALIPLVMVPAMEHDFGAVLIVSLVFSAFTIGTMLVMVALGSAGLRLVPMRAVERHANTLAGLAIAASGLAIQLLGI